MTMGVPDRVENVENPKDERKPSLEQHRIEPTKFNDINSWRFYLSVSTKSNNEKGKKSKHPDGNLRDVIRSIILEKGNLIAENYGEVKPELIMGLIRYSDVVLFLPDKNENKLELSCECCQLSTNCKKRARDGCNVFAFEMACARFFGKEVREISSRDAFETFFDQDGFKNNNKRRDDRCFLELLNEFIQLSYKPQTIGQYTITSNEMEAKEGSEIHILTNEMYNYDFTPTSSLTTALNTQKGVHYFFYGTETAEKSFEEFKKHLEEYYNGNEDARKNIVAWIRHARFNSYYFERLIGKLKSSDSDKEFLGSLGIPNEKIQGEIIQNFDFEKTSKWISGGILPEIDEKRIYELIDSLSELIPKLKERALDATFNDIAPVILALKNMKLLTQWQTLDTNEIQEEDKKKLLKYFSNNEQGEKILSDKMENWLKNSAPLSDPSIDGSSNVHFCKVSDKNPCVLAYNFVLFLGSAPNGVGTKNSAAWYTTEKEYNNTAVSIDNHIIMVDVKNGDLLYNKVANAFKTLIENNPSAKETLSQANSKLLEELNLK